MKFITTNFKLFESLSDEQQEFLSQIIGKYQVVDGEVNISGPVDLSRRKISKVPVKFGSVSGSFDCSRNNLNSFEFLPDFCTNYYLYDNPGYKGTLENINLQLQKVDSYQSLWVKFIQECLNFHVWSDGKTNDFAMNEVFLNIKNAYYFSNKDKFIEIASILTLDDEDILSDFFNLKNNNLSDLISAVLDKIKTSKGESRIQFFQFLYNLSISDEKDEVRNILVNDYDIEDFYNKMERLSKIKYRKTEFQHLPKVVHVRELNTLENELDILSKRLNNSDYETQRNQENDFFAFIASDKFVKNKSGSYDKKLDIENLCKLNIYDVSDLRSINMMKFRAVAQNSKLYKIWLPKGTFDIEKNNYYGSDIPDYILELIDKYKEPI